MASKSGTKKAGRGSAGSKARRGSSKATKPVPRGRRRSAGSAKLGRSKSKPKAKAKPKANSKVKPKASGGSKKATKKVTKKAIKKQTKKSMPRAKATKAVKRPASRATKAAAAAQPPSAGGVVLRNPLTHRGTRRSRTQLLFDHQGAPVEAVAATASGGTGQGVRGSNLGELVRNTEVRNMTLKSLSASSRAKRIESLLSTGGNPRIGGHASGAGRRAQGRRDAARRGEKRPGAAD